MKFLLLGKNGQLGWELQRCLPSLGTVIAVDYPELDMAHGPQVRSLVKENRPDVIINATAYTAVDKAEGDEDTAMAVNAIGPGILAEETKEHNAVLIHYSTDYVFDGTKSEPYIESDPPNPINVYGQSKFEGEKNVREVDGAFLIFRTSWVYSLRQGGFVRKVLDWAREKEVLSIVSDQVGSPTWARILAEVTTQILVKAGGDPYAWINQRRGLYHLGGEGTTSRLNWAKSILKYDPKKEEQVVREIIPAKTSEFPTPARRPLHTPLNCGLFVKTFGLRLPGWEETLRLAMD